MEIIRTMMTNIQAPYKEECYICGSTKIEFYKKIKGFSLLKCKKCNLKWVVNITEKEIIEFYDQNYFYSNSKMGYADYLADEKNHRRNAKSILHSVNKIKDLTKLKVLDVGCAMGFLLDEARRFKACDVYGVEVSNYAYAYAKSSLEIDVIHGELDSSHFASEFFDVVFLIGTIEHLLSPKKTLAIINRVLKSDGLLVITTIDTSGLFRLYSIKPPEHLFYFNHNNIVILLTKLGFKIIKIKPYFVSYYLHDLFHRLSEFFSFSFLEFVSGVIKRKMPNFYVKIPTNEMILIVKKIEEVEDL